MRSHCKVPESLLEPITSRLFYFERSEKQIIKSKGGSVRSAKQVLQQKIAYTDVQKAALFHEFVEPRLAALVQLKEALDSDFDLFTYVPGFYPFITKIKADYLIATQQEPISFVFIIKESPSGESICDYLCCSAFEKGDCDYRINQQRRTLLKKTCIHIESQSTTVLYNRFVDESSATEESFLTTI